MSWALVAVPISFDNGGSSTMLLSFTKLYGDAGAWGRLLSWFVLVFFVLFELKLRLVFVFLKLLVFFVFWFVAGDLGLLFVVLGLVLGLDSLFCFVVL